MGRPLQELENGQIRPFWGGGKKRPFLAPPIDHFLRAVASQCPREVRDPPGFFCTSRFSAFAVSRECLNRGARKWTDFRGRFLRGRRDIFGPKFGAFFDFFGKKPVSGRKSGPFLGGAKMARFSCFFRSETGFSLRFANFVILR